MKPKVFNAILRVMFKRILSGGFKRNALCRRILGNQRLAQLDSLLNGNDLGIQPLSRIVENLGYELWLIPVEPNDIDTKMYLEELTQQFTEQAESILIESLQHKESKRKKRDKQNDNVDESFIVTSEEINNADLE